MSSPWWRLRLGDRINDLHAGRQSARPRGRGGSAGTQGTRSQLGSAAAAPGRGSSGEGPMQVLSPILCAPNSLLRSLSRLPDPPSSGTLLLGSLLAPPVDLGAPPQTRDLGQPQTWGGAGGGSGLRPCGSPLTGLHTAEMDSQPLSQGSCEGILRSVAGTQETPIKYPSNASRILPGPEPLGHGPGGAGGKEGVSHLWQGFAQQRLRWGSGPPSHRAGEARG